MCIPDSSPILEQYSFLWTIIQQQTPLIDSNTPINVMNSYGLPRAVPKLLWTLRNYRSLAHELLWTLMNSCTQDQCCCELSWTVALKFIHYYGLAWNSHLVGTLLWTLETCARITKLDIDFTFHQISHDCGFTSMVSWTVYQGRNCRWNACDARF